MSEAEEDEKDARCFACGAPTDIQFGEKWICESCYVSRSSCCTEFEEDDSSSSPSEKT